GGLLVRIVDFRQTLVRLDWPPEVLTAEPPETVELSSVPAIPAALRGATNRPAAGKPVPPVSAARVGAAPQVDPASQYMGYFYKVLLNISKDKTEAETIAWRPGLFVKAEVPVPAGATQDAVSIPATALLYHQGRALVYVRVEPGKYE